MSESTGFGAYVLYSALKLHFTTKSYDYFKYNGKTNVTQDTFMRNNSKFSFYKLSRKYSMDELRNFFVANFVYGSSKWVNDLLTTDGEECYSKWQKVNQSLTYKFRSDVDFLFDEQCAGSLMVKRGTHNSRSAGSIPARRTTPNILKVEDGQYPILLQAVMTQDVSIETVAIMNDMMNFFPMWEKKINDDIIWPSWKMKIEKYTPFINYDKTKFTNILKEALEEYA